LNKIVFPVDKGRRKATELARNNRYYRQNPTLSTQASMGTEDVFQELRAVEVAIKVDQDLSQQSGVNAGIRIASFRYGGSEESGDEIEAGIIGMTRDDDASSRTTL
jgi:hypothetical protein